MSEQPAGEKTFAPTPKRRQDAAKKGDVLRSKEVATAIAILFGGAWLMLGGPWIFEGLRSTAIASFRFDYLTFEGFTAATLAMFAMRALLPPLLLLGGTVMVVTVASQLLFGEGRFQTSNLKPKGSRVNPLSGFKRMFGPKGLIELMKGLLKIGLMGGIAGWWAISNIPPLISMGRGELTMQLAVAWDSAVALMMLLALGLIIIAMIDWPIQYVRQMQRLKMTHQEMRDEMKQAEGSPEKKAAQRQRQRDLARGGVTKAMDKAQFLITNPTHFSIALTYDPELAPAPVVLAKGRGEKALAMREMAAERGLPVLEYPMLARSVYYTTREAQVVREELYVAIAALVAFVFALQRGEHPARPHVEVPVDLRFDAEGTQSTALGPII